MKRRSFLRLLAGAGAVALTPISFIPQVDRYRTSLGDYYMEVNKVTAEIYAPKLMEQIFQKNTLMARLMAANFDRAIESGHPIIVDTGLDSREYEL